MKNKIIFFVSYIFIYILYLASAIVSLKESNFLGIIILQCAFVMKILTSLYLLFAKKRIGSVKFHLQYFLLELLLGLFYLSALLSDQTDKTYRSVIVLMGICLFCSLLYEVISIKKIPFRYYVQKVDAKGYSSIIICFVFFLLSIPLMKTSFMWDSEVYINRIVKNASVYDFTFSGIKDAVSTHFQLGFDLIYSLLYNLLGSNGNLLILANIFLGMITIWLFGKIVLFLIPQMPQKEYVLSVLIFAFSPLFLGTIGGIHLDFAMMCFFIWFVYAHMKKLKVLQLFFGILLCFSKEPGVILGAGYIGFFILAEIITDCKSQTDKKIKITNFINFSMIKKHLTEIIPFALFVLIFLSKGGTRWTNNEKVTDNYIMNAFGYIGSGYIIEKLKSVFILNYSWVIWICIIMLTVVICYKKIQIKNVRYILALSLSFVFYFIFNCFYITYLHPRYIMSIIFIISIILVYLVHYAFQYQLYRRIVLFVIAFLLLFQSFFNLDKVTQAYYKSIPTGNGQLISTRYFDKYQYSDANIYNRQHMYLQYSLLKFLNEIAYTENDLLIFPDILYELKEEGSRYSILGLTKEKNELFYNKKSKRLDNFYEEGSQKLHTYFYNKESKDDFLSDYKRIFYIDIGILENKDDTTKAFFDQFNVISKKRYSTLSWKISVYTIKK